MSQRKRKRTSRRPARPARDPLPARRAQPPAFEGYRARNAERDALARAKLTPLEQGERPWPLAAASLVALVLGVTTLVMYVTGTKVAGSTPSTGPVIVYCGLMLACAVGCWTKRYWAVLGFQTLLGIGIIGLALALVRVDSLLWALVCLLVIGVGGFLFWKLVRVLGRLQMPVPPSRLR